MKYVIIAIILFLIETEYNYRVNLCNLEQLLKFEDKIDFVVQRNPNPNFRKSYFRWKNSNPENLFPKYKKIQMRRELFVQHCLRIFGEDKLIDLIEKSKSNLIKKYGNDVIADLEVFEILIKHFSITEFKRYINKK